MNTGIQKKFKKKNFVLVGLATGAAFYLSSKQNRIKTKGIVRGLKRSLVTPAIDKTQLPINKAGNPDPLDMDDNKMVDEGAMYSVNYYNEKKQ